MSAYVVNVAHIDALVTAAVEGPQDAEGWTPRRVTWMAGQVRHEASHETADRLGRLLWAENVASVEYRYPGAPGAPVNWIAYKWTRRVGGVSCVAALKALDCYEYQSCEHSGWDGSEAREFCDALRSAVIHSLPGYGAAEWEIS